MAGALESMEQFTFKLERLLRDWFQIGTSLFRETNANKLSNARVFPAFPIVSP